MFSDCIWMFNDTVAAWFCARDFMCPMHSVDVLLQIFQGTFFGTVWADSLSTRSPFGSFFFKLFCLSTFAMPQVLQQKPLVYKIFWTKTTFELNFTVMVSVDVLKTFVPAFSFKVWTYPAF